MKARRDKVVQKKFTLSTRTDPDSPLTARQDGLEVRLADGFDAKANEDYPRLLILLTKDAVGTYYEAHNVGDLLGARNAVGTLKGSLKQKRKQLHASKEKLRETTEAARAESARQKSEIETVSAQFELLQNSESKREHDLKTKIENLERDNSGLRKNIQVIKKGVERLDGKVDETLEKHTAEKAALEAKIAKLQRPLHKKIWEKFSRKNR